jgi:hypothetical protein
MTVYVDPLSFRGWRIRGRDVANCHLFTDQVDLRELHGLASAIGMHLEWFQDARSAPHYDLTPTRRAAALAAGAVAVDFRQAVHIWRARRTLLVCPGGEGAFNSHQSLGVMALAGHGAHRHGCGFKPVETAHLAGMPFKSAS